MVDNETITVEKVNQYGVHVGGKQYNYSKNYSGQKLVAGQTVTASIYTSATGAKYINQVCDNPVVLEVAARGLPFEAPPAPIKRAYKSKVSLTPPERAASVLPMGRDFDKENRGKTRCALLEALYSNPNVVTDLGKMNVEDIYKVVEDGVNFVFDTRKKAE